MDDVVSYYGSLFADFWKNIPIDLHIPSLLERFLCQHGVRIHPPPFFLPQMKDFRLVCNSAAGGQCGNWNNWGIKKMIKPSILLLSHSVNHTYCMIK